MPRYGRVHGAIQAAVPLLAPTQAANLALLVSAILAKRTRCLSELARALWGGKKPRGQRPSL